MVYPYVYMSSLANVHCNESVVWFKISGFCDTINTRSSPLFILVLLCVTEIPQIWNNRIYPHYQGKPSHLQEAASGLLLLSCLLSLLTCPHLQSQLSSLCFPVKVRCRAHSHLPSTADSEELGQLLSHSPLRVASNLWGQHHR